MSGGHEIKRFGFEHYSQNIKAEQLQRMD